MPDLKPKSASGDPRAMEWQTAQARKPSLGERRRARVVGAARTLGDSSLRELLLYPSAMECTAGSEQDAVEVPSVRRANKRMKAVTNDGAPSEGSLAWFLKRRCVCRLFL